MATKRRNFAILRLEKVKTRGALKARSDHNRRADSRGVEHTDPTRPPTLLVGREDAVEAWDRRISDLAIDPKKLRRDSVLAVEYLATASADFWSKATPEQRTKWTADTLEFLAEQAGGEANILSAWMHEDETTPHIQMLTIPAVQKTKKTRGRPRKGREHQPRAEATGWTLSAKDLIGGPRDRLAEMQDAYAEKMAPLGLERGVSRKETGARNRAPAQWRAEQARLYDETQTKSAAMLEGLAESRAETRRADARRKAALDEREQGLHARERELDRRAEILAAAMKQAGRTVPPKVQDLADASKKRRAAERGAER